VKIFGPSSFQTTKVNKVPVYLELELVSFENAKPFEDIAVSVAFNFHAHCKDFDCNTGMLLAKGMALSMLADTQERQRERFDAVNFAKVSGSSLIAPDSFMALYQWALVLILHAELLG